MGEGLVSGHSFCSGRALTSALTASLCLSSLQQPQVPSAFLWCVGFVSDMFGWGGTLCPSLIQEMGTEIALWETESEA